ncbi:MAG: flippase [Ardenticatenaceae bacterium]|nr:flippase [Ardenticatenaceae bacterium]
MSNQSGNSIAKNASYLLGSQLITWVLTLAVTVIIPRVLGPANLGKLHLAESIWLMGLIGIGFGSEFLITREIARYPERTNEIFGTNIVLRLFFYVLTFAGILSYAYIVDYSQEIIWLLVIAGIATFFTGLNLFAIAANEGLERMEYNSLGAISNKLVYTVLAITVVLLGYGVFAVAALGVVAMIVQSFVVYRGLNKINPLKFTFSWDVAKWMVSNSVSFLGTSIFATAYHAMDIIIMSLLISDEVQLGWYTVADRLFGTTMFIPSIFITAIYPVLSRMFAEDKNSLSKIITRSFNLLLIVSVPIGMGLIIIATPVVILIFGPEYAGAGPVLSIIGVVLIFTYQNTLLGRFMMSIDRQNTWTVVMAVATLATIPLDFILVPWTNTTFGNGAMGGALAYVITEGGMMIAAFYLIPKGYLGRENLVVAAKALLAGAAMMGVVWFVKDQFIAIPILVGMVVYPVFILMLKAIPTEDLALLQEVGKSFLGRFRVGAQVQE